MNTEHSVVISSPTFYVPAEFNVIASVVAHSRNVDSSFDVPLGEASVTVGDKEAIFDQYIKVDYHGLYYVHYPVVVSFAMHQI